MKMGSMVFIALVIFLIFYTICFSGIVVADCQKGPRCTVTRVHRLKAADCFQRDFKQFPNCLSTDVEVIELTSNRIRKISRSDLAPFRYLQFLYLQDNLIFKIDDDVFYDMNSLLTLDLSVNAITKLPTVIFQLPSLRTLYLSQNVNMNIIDALDSAKPIRSPLEKVDISFTTDEDNINKFPDFGPVPNLMLLNITGNQYVTMTRQNLVGFCNLKILANDNVTTGFEDACECVRINQMLRFFNVKFTPFVCSVVESAGLLPIYATHVTMMGAHMFRHSRFTLFLNSRNLTFETSHIVLFPPIARLDEARAQNQSIRDPPADSADCPHLPYTKEEKEIMQQCKEIVENWEREYKMWKLSVGLGVIAAILVLSLLLYCLTCRKKYAKHQVPVDETGLKKPPDNLELLNNQATAVANEYVL